MIARGRGGSVGARFLASSEVLDVWRMCFQNQPRKSFKTANPHGPLLNMRHWPANRVVIALGQVPRRFVIGPRRSSQRNLSYFRNKIFSLYDLGHSYS